MKLSDINIRDPFIVPEDGKYYILISDEEENNETIKE